MNYRSDDSTADWTWQVDSETGCEVLIDCKTWRIIAERDRNGVIRNYPQGDDK